jgi:hypothetical protein
MCRLLEEEVIAHAESYNLPWKDTLAHRCHIAGTIWWYRFNYLVTRLTYDKGRHQATASI